MGSPMSTAALQTRHPTPLQGSCSLFASKLFVSRHKSACLTTAREVCCTQFQSRAIKQPHDRLTSGTIQALPGLVTPFTLTQIPLSEKSVLVFEALAAALVALVIVIYQSRPRGWCNHNLVQVAPSQVAGQGVFASKYIPKNTAIGAYPGVQRKADSMIRKAAVAPNCKRYVFNTSSHIWLDPTDNAGVLSSQLNLSFLGLACDVSMAYMNEPPTGYVVNVEIVDGIDKLDLVFMTTCDIQAGTELFLDYGRTYDRSSYK